MSVQQGGEYPFMSGRGLDNEIRSVCLVKCQDKTEQETQERNLGEGSEERALDSLVSPRRLRFIRVWKPAMAKRVHPRQKRL